MDTYWQKRINLKCYQKIEDLVNDLIQQKKASSILDVGGRDGYFLTKFPSVEKRICVDKSKTSRLNVHHGIETLNLDFLEYHPNERFDIVICSHVLEYLDHETIKVFTQKLFQLGKRVIISVPYRWNEGFCKNHLQDPIDETKLRSWTDRRPNRKIIANDRQPRLITYYRSDY